MSHNLERRLVRLEQQRRGNGVKIIDLRRGPIDLEQAEREADAKSQILVIINDLWAWEKHDVPAASLILR